MTYNFYSKQICDQSLNTNFERSQVRILIPSLHDDIMKLFYLTCFALLKIVNLPSPTSADFINCFLQNNINCSYQFISIRTKLYHLKNKIRYRQQSGQFLNGEDDKVHITLVKHMDPCIHDFICSFTIRIFINFRLDTGNRPNLFISLL